MKTNNIAIKIDGVSKQYRLGSIGGKTLQNEIQSWWAGIRKKEDPNSKIGSKKAINAKFYALEGINLTINQGERVGIIGNNGAGKSTLLKLLSRITAPTSGDIDVYGRISSLLEVGTGFHREMTGRENVYMNGAILGMSKKEIDAKIEKIIEFSEVGEFIDTPVKRYSSGMLVKLAFAVAAYLDSEILVMDEVLAVGDMAFQEKCLLKMREEADKEDKTILYVSHNMETIRHLCERVIVLDKGHIIYDGEVEGGIAIYLNHNSNNDLVDIDLKDKAIQTSDEINLLDLSLTDKDAPIYKNDESLKIKLLCDVKKPYKDLSLRLTFRNDSDTGIGTAYSKHITFEETGLFNVFFDMPLKDFAKGTMYVSLGLYKNDELGRYISIEHITRAFKIEIEGLPIWDVRAHGFVELSEIQIERIEKK